MKLMLVVPICTLFCSLLLAFAVTQCRLKEKSIYRVLFFFPSVTPYPLQMVSSGLLYFIPDHGNFKQFFKQRGSFWTYTFLDRRYKDSTCLYCSNSDLAGSWILYGHVCGGYGMESQQRSMNRL